SVLLGTGGGALAAAVNYTVGSSPQAVAVDDFGGDGKLDVAVANYNNNTVSIFPGNGDGTLGTRVDVAANGSNPNWIVAVDLTGQGKSDLATGNYGDGTVSVLRNNGSGVFAAGVTYPTIPNTSFGVYDIIAGDFNGDGKQDLAVANHNYGRTGVYLGNGDGTLQAAQNYAVNSIALVAADFNEDGRLDLATAS